MVRPHILVVAVFRIDPQRIMFLSFQWFCSTVLCQYKSTRSEKPFGPITKHRICSRTTFPPSFFPFILQNQLYNQKNMKTLDTCFQKGSHHRTPKTPKMDGVHGWLASRPARFFKKKSCQGPRCMPARRRDHPAHACPPFWTVQNPFNL